MRCDSESAGSLIVEALVAITLLGSVGAASQSLFSSAQDARHRSLERMVASWELRSRLEVSPGTASAGLESDASAMASWLVLAGPVGIEVERHPVEVAPSSPRTGCWQAPPMTAGAVRVLARRPVDGQRVASIQRAQGLRDAGATDLRSGPHVLPALSVLVVDADGLPVVGAPVTVIPNSAGAGGANLAMSHASTNYEGCAALEGLGGGSHDLAVDMNGHVDRLHRPVGDPRIVSLVPGIQVRHRVVAAAAASLTVTTEATTGSMLPDHVDDGVLAWALAGDGAAGAVGDSTALLVHPGRHDVVVGVCEGSLGIGTWATATLEAGSDHALVVTLPSIVLPSISVPPEGVSVLARRDTDCPGSNGTRPRLRWDITSGSATTVTLSPEIALPHGPWLIEVRSPGGAVLAGPERVQVTGNGGEG
jgi:hypothetical protein